MPLREYDKKKMQIRVREQPIKLTDIRHVTKGLSSGVLNWNVTAW